MSDLYADDIIERRRLRRKVTFWRVVTLALALAAIAGLWIATGGGSWLGERSQPHIAKIMVEGTITEDQDLLDLIDRVRESSGVKGVILSVDSPGGTTTGGEAIFEAVRKLAEEKPVVSQVGTLAASAGYMIASAADHIVARQTSIVGSIGVLFQYPNVSELLDKLGIDVRAIKSSPLKAEPNFFDNPPPGAEEMIRSMIMDSFAWFKDLVQKRRPLSGEEVDALADGSVFTGRQALKNKLIDELGGEETAKKWLVSKGLDDDLEVIEWKPKTEQSGLLLTRAVARMIGFDASGAPAVKALADRLLLDGLVSVWHGGTQ